MKFFLLIAKNIRRNLLRAALTALGTIVLVFVITLIWSVLFFLDTVTAEKSKNLKAIATERWQIPSQMPFAYAATLSQGAARHPSDVRPSDSMTWQFYGGTLDLQKRTRENSLFAVAIEARKIGTMVEELEEFKGKERAELDENIRKMELDKRAIVIGPAILRNMHKLVGQTIKLSGLNYPGIDLEFNIVGTLPEGRYSQTSFMNRDYLNDAVDAWPRSHRGVAHPMAGKSLNLVWLRVADQDAYARLAEQIMTSPYYGNPAVKVETLSSGIAGFMDAYRDILWAMKWLLSPAILVTLALVISNAISISVRERRLEMAVLKVLGFQPWQLMILVLGEALLIGTLSGLASTSATYAVVNFWMGGIKFPIAFFPAFMIPAAAFWWGAAIGSSTALIGSVVPAWSARNVKVADVFAKVA